MISSQTYFNVSSRYKKIRNVLAFPKIASAQDLMMDSPGEVDDSQLKELEIGITEKPN
jgi:aspartyl-tRNA synthetase